MEVAYPFLLELYRDYDAGTLYPEDFAAAVRLGEAYFFRRSVVRIPTNSLNKTFATLARSLRKEHYLESLQAELVSLPSYRRFPDDEEFGAAFATRDMYNFRNRAYWLRRLENYARKEFVPVSEYTVEHILPRNENLGEEWRTVLGHEWNRVQKTWVHTSGNLTLTGYNSEYGDRPFAEKRDMDGGFRHSPLWLNEGLGEEPTWDEEAIGRRAASLMARAVTVWARPALPVRFGLPELSSAPASPARTVEWYPHLAAGTPMRSLFERVRLEILDLGPELSVSGQGIPPGGGQVIPPGPLS